MASSAKEAGVFKPHDSAQSPEPALWARFKMSSCALTSSGLAVQAACTGSRRSEPHLGRYRAPTAFVGA